MFVFEITINYPVLCQKICIDLVIEPNFPQFSQPISPRKKVFCVLLSVMIYSGNKLGIIILCTRQRCTRERKQKTYSHVCVIKSVIT